MKKTALFLASLILAGSMIIPEAHTSAVSSSFIYGDIDQNSDIDLSDLTLLSQHLLKDITLEGDQLLAADVKYDGNTDILDAALLKQYIMKDDVSLGKAETDTTSPAVTTAFIPVSVQTSARPEVTDPSQDKSSDINAELIKVVWPAGYPQSEVHDYIISSENELNDFVASENNSGYKTKIENTVASLKNNSADFFNNNTLIACRIIGGALDWNYHIDSVSVSKEKGIEIKIERDSDDLSLTTRAIPASFICILSVPNDKIKGIELNENTISFPNFEWPLM